MLYQGPLPLLPVVAAAIFVVSVNTISKIDWSTSIGRRPFLVPKLWAIIGTTGGQA